MISLLDTDFDTCRPCPGAVIGDTLAQWFTGASYDVARNMRMSLYGLIVGGPSGHYWHKVSRHLQGNLRTANFVSFWIVSACIYI